jgi:hypothetical protein
MNLRLSAVCLDHLAYFRYLLTGPGHATAPPAPPALNTAAPPGLVSTAVAPAVAATDDYEIMDDWDGAVPLREDAVGAGLDADERDIDDYDGDGFDHTRPVSGIKADAPAGNHAPELAIAGGEDDNPDGADGDDNDDQRRLKDIGALDDDEESSADEGVGGAEGSGTSPEDEVDLGNTAADDADGNFTPALEEVFEWRWSWPVGKRHEAASQLLRRMCRQLVLLRQEWEVVVDAARRRKAEAGAAVLKNATIVGATVVGISKRLDKVRAAEPFAAVVEEACEVMEPTLISVLAVRSLQKLELVGDHRQLPAFVQQCWYEVSDTMPTIKTSMFERLIGDANWEKTSGARQRDRHGEQEVHRVPFSVLDEQRRMRSNIADLTRSHYKDVTAITDHGKTATQQLGDFLDGHKEKEFMDQLRTLKEHRSIFSASSNKYIPGLPTNIFFWDLPGNKESRNPAGMSACNESEAVAVTALARWLLLCGAPAAGITVITPYKGQKNLILKKLRDEKLVPLPTRKPLGQPHSREDMSCITVSTVDTFQGDENDIILLSLVRVNPGNRFIELKNRFVVALSRARIATFVIGSVDAVTKPRREGGKAPQHWVDLVQHLRTEEVPVPAQTTAAGPAVAVSRPQQSTTGTTNEKAHGSPAGSSNTSLVDSSLTSHWWNALFGTSPVKQQISTTAESREVRQVPQAQATVVQPQSPSVAVQAQTQARTQARPAAVSRVGPALPVCCPQHSTSCRTVEKASDFPSKLQWNAFCRRVCDYKLPCTHECALPCHATSPGAHTQPAQCAVPVPRPCQRHSAIPLLCGKVQRTHPSEACASAMKRFKCEVRVLHSRPECNHKVELSCADDEMVTQKRGTLTPCAEVVDDFVKACGHVIKKPICSERQIYEKTPPVCAEKVVHTRPHCGCKVQLLCGASRKELNEYAAGVSVCCVQNKTVRRPRCGHNFTGKCHITTPLSINWGRNSGGVSATFPVSAQDKLTVPYQANYYGLSERACCDESIPDCEVMVDYLAKCGHLYSDVLCHQAFNYARSGDFNLPLCQSMKHVPCFLCSARAVAVPCWSAAYGAIMKDIFALGQRVEAVTGVITVDEAALERFSAVQRGRVLPGVHNAWKDICDAKICLQRPCGHAIETSCKQLFGWLMRTRAPGERLLPPCTARVDRPLRCGHTVSVGCSVRDSQPEPPCKVVNTVVYAYPCAQHTVVPATCAELLQLRAAGARAQCPTIMPATLHRCKHVVHVPCFQSADASAVVGVGACLSTADAVLRHDTHYCMPCEVAPQCVKEVSVHFPCGHQRRAPCHAAFDWVESEFADAPRCTVEVQVDSPICGHSLTVMCWEATALRNWNPWPAGALLRAESVLQPGPDGQLTNTLQLYEGNTKPATLPQGIKVERLRCQVPALYKRLACDHILATECSRAYYQTVQPCAEPVRPSCLQCEFVRTIPCSQHTAEKNSGKTQPCRNAVTRRCQVCQVNDVEVECFKTDVRCNRKVEAALSCGHEVPWLCGSDGDPRKRSRPEDYCVSCQLPRWDDYIATVTAASRKIPRAGMFASAKKAIDDAMSDVATVVRRQDLGYDGATHQEHCAARQRIAQAMVDSLQHNNSALSQAVCAPPPCPYLSAEDTRPGDQYSYTVVACTVPAKWTDSPVDTAHTRFTKPVHTHFGLGVGVRPFSADFVKAVFASKKDAADGDAIHLCVGVLYSLRAFQTKDKFANGTTKKTSAERAVQTQRQLGFDSVRYTPTDGASELVTWESGAAVPLLIVSLEQKASCAVCMDCYGVADGYTCTGTKGKPCAQFTCWGCLTRSYAEANKPDAIKGAVTGDGELVCSNPKCKCALTVARLVQAHATPTAEVLQAQQELRVKVVKDREVQEALATQKKQIEAEYARIEAIKDADEKASAKLRLKIVEEVLTLRCPRCKTAFLDFNGCCALTCGNRTCNAGFCAWCQKDCGADAHRHVARCPDSASGGDVFASDGQIRAGQNRRKTRLAREMIHGADLNQRARGMLQGSLDRDLRDLGINPADVFGAPAARPAPAAPAPAANQGYGMWNRFGQNW